MVKTVTPSLPILAVVFLFICAPLHISASSAQEEATEPIRCGIVYPVEKIRPDEPVSEAGLAPGPLIIAGGEREPFLFVVQNRGDEAKEITALSVSIFPAGVSVAVYRVEYVEITKPTPVLAGSGRKGRWPDPLIPLTGGEIEAGKNADNRITGAAGTCTRSITIELSERLTVPAGENRCFLIDLYRPHEEPGIEQDGRYAAGAPQSRGAVTVTAFLKDSTICADIDLELLPFSLPVAQRLTTAFGFNWQAVQYKHRQLSEAPFGKATLHREYLRQLAVNRIAPFVPWRDQLTVSRDAGTAAVDWSSFDAVAGKLLDGELFEDAPAATSFVFPYPAKETSDEDRAVFYPEAIEHLRENGWIEKAFYYLPDEPLRSQYDLVRERAEGFASRAPGVRRLVTEPFAKSLAGYVEIWCPDVISIGDTFPLFPAYFKSDGLHLDWQVNPRPGRYAERQELGEEVWFYTSTASQAGSYPNLFIDYPAAYARIIPWIAYLYGFTGVLHWETSYDYRGKENPWTDFNNFHANGDGNLLYPGLPGENGLKDHRALPSIRLILFREGVEDYEYLSLAADVAGGDMAFAIAQTMARTSVRWEEEPDKFYEMKQRAATLITEHNE